MEQRILTDEQARELSGFSRSYWDKLNADGAIPGCSKPTGKKRFFDRKKFEDWLLSNPKTNRREHGAKAALYVNQ